MKNMIAIALLSLAGATAFATAVTTTAAEHFYECNGLADVDEYRVGINLKSKRAGFFDNDHTFYMKLTETKILESLPPQTQMIFEGKERRQPGSLKLYFNLTRKTVALYSIDKKGEATEIGSASCENASPWDDLD